MSFVMGIDLGTAGVRTAVIDAADVMIAAASVPMQSPVRVENRPCQDPTILVARGLPVSWTTGRDPWGRRASHW